MIKCAISYNHVETETVLRRTYIITCVQVGTLPIQYVYQIKRILKSLFMRHYLYASIMFTMFSQVPSTYTKSCYVYIKYTMYFPSQVNKSIYSNTILFYLRKKNHIIFNVSVLVSWRGSLALHNIEFSIPCVYYFSKSYTSRTCGFWNVLCFVLPLLRGQRKQTNNFEYTRITKLTRTNCQVHINKPGYGVRK